MGSLPRLRTDDVHHKLLDTQLLTGRPDLVLELLGSVVEYLRAKMQTREVSDLARGVSTVGSRRDMGELVTNAVLLHCSFDLRPHCFDTAIIEYLHREGVRGQPTGSALSTRARLLQRFLPTPRLRHFGSSAYGLRALRSTAYAGIRAFSELRASGLPRGAEREV